MTILSKAEIEELKAESQEGLLDTLDAMWEALEAWARWANGGDLYTEEDRQEEEVAWNNAIELTKAAGIEWKEDSQP